MKIIHTTEVFDAWFAGLTDRTGKFRIQARIDRVEMGNFGDCEPVGEGVSELRIHFVRVTACILPSVGLSW